MAAKITLKHRLEALMIWALPLALRPLPFRMRVKVGGALIGGLIRLVPPLRRRITDNLALIYPDLPASAHRDLLGRISKNIGRRFIETFFATEFSARLDEMHVNPDGLVKLKEVQASGRAVFMVSGHFGQWVAGRAALRQYGIESGALYRVNANPIFEKHYVKTLVDGGEPIVPTGVAGMRTLIRHLRVGGVMSVLLDQRLIEGPVLTFMGQPAITSPAIAELAIRHNAAMMPVYATFREDGRHIDIEVEDEIPHSDPLRMMQAINDSLSARVRKNPEQWYWLHRRWKIEKDCR